jgi:excisionase family DNA binding protein
MKTESTMADLQNIERRDRLTMTVEEAGRLLGIGRSQAYEAARRGELPSIRIGRRILVPVVAFEEMLRGSRTQRTDNRAL